MEKRSIHCANFVSIVGILEGSSFLEDFRYSEGVRIFTEGP